MKESRISVSVVRDIVNFAAAQGASAEEICRAAGVASALLTEPDKQIAGHHIYRAWQKAEELTGDADIGLHLGEQIHPTAIGLIGFVMLSCETLGEALEKLTRYTNLMSDGIKGKLLSEKSTASIEVNVVGDVENFLLEAPRQPIESILSAIATVARHLTGRPLPITEVHFQHSRPSNISEHQRIFDAPVSFNQTSNILRFSSDALEYKILLANKDLLTALETQAEQLLTELDNQETLSAKAQREIIKKLKGDAPTIGDIARALGMSERSLQRELNAEGTSFREVLDRARQDLALRHLRNKKTSVAEVAFLLGFSEPSAFHRSFKRWTGQTPHAFREKNA